MTVYHAYLILTTLLFPVFVPLFWVYSRLTGRFRQSFSQMLGLRSNCMPVIPCGRPRIWIHAVSVGEVGVALAIIEALRKILPQAAFILSVTTEHGYAYATDRIKANHLKYKITPIFAPLDFPGCVRRTLSVIQPDILACLETEIWPNLLIEAHQRGVRTALVNGRISVRSIHDYLKIRPLIRTVLKRIDRFSMIGEEDRQRILLLGAPPERITVCGNAKYDLLLCQADKSVINQMRQLYNIHKNQPVFVTGSIRGPEETAILEAFREIVRVVPETILIIAPRHRERTSYIARKVTEQGFEYQLRTELDTPAQVRHASVVIIDTIGELLATYSIASAVFCGGSLVPLGGQNILEPAVWGKPVLYGPSMEDFSDAKALLELTGGSIQVKDSRELAQKVSFLLTHPDEAAAIGQKALEAVLLNKGAAVQHARAIISLVRAGRYRTKVKNDKIMYDYNGFR